MLPLIFNKFWNFNFMICFESLIILIIMIFWIRNCVIKISLLTQCLKKNSAENTYLQCFQKHVWNSFSEEMLAAGREKYQSCASCSSEYMKIFMSTSSCCIFNWTIHWWNLMRWSEGLSSLLSLNRGRQSPQTSIVGTGFEKLGISEKIERCKPSSQNSFHGHRPLHLEIVESPINFSRQILFFSPLEATVTNLVKSSLKNVLV